MPIRQETFVYIPRTSVQYGLRDDCRRQVENGRQGFLVFWVTVWRNATPEKARKRQAHRILRNREYFPPFGSELTPWDRPSNIASSFLEEEENSLRVSVLLYIYENAVENFIRRAVASYLQVCTYIEISTYLVTAVLHRDEKAASLPFQHPCLL